MPKCYTIYLILLPDCYCIYLSEKGEAPKLQISGRHEDILADQFCTDLLFQEKDTEKVFYGLDDIEGESDIIIVKWTSFQWRKLAFVIVCVPDGAPAQVSTKDLPPEDKDIKYLYLWNCKEYLKKVASRIILAIDGDLPFQSLAEELACHLGKERCWRVKWPKSYEINHFKDANEVLMYLRPQVLKEVIENAELYP
ncbi:hypothetical protein Patl1_11535 [Pistacia atlantica]|uniref:Uncharacterized protein n=1 Tax=Pistacia atlantica TaxID=434234 RepID=A0ACC1A6P5_9ROSI|nr:hypothetical protein Patl1_11535 [Pistacia atlantica]